MTNNACLKRAYICKNAMEMFFALLRIHRLSVRHFYSAAPLSSSRSSVVFDCLSPSSTTAEIYLSSDQSRDTLVFVVCLSDDQMMRLYDGCKEILKIQKFRRIVSYAGFFAFSAVISYAYTSNTTRAGYSRADQFYASYPAGTELLTDAAKLYKAALGSCFEEEEWGPIEWSVMAKHFERQGKSPYAYHAQYMAHLASHGQLDGSG